MATQTGVVQLTPELLANGAVRAHNFDPLVGQSLLGRYVTPRREKLMLRSPKFPRRSLLPSSVAGRGDPSIRTVHRRMHPRRMCACVY